MKLSAVDLETQFASLEGIDDVCALSMPLDQQDTLAIAIACAETVDLVQLRLRIAALLPRHMHFALVRVATIPRNAMGKIMRIPLAERVKSIIERAPAQLQALEN